MLQQINLYFSCSKMPIAKKGTKPNENKKAA
jgi:hypothetical protein